MIATVIPAVELEALSTSHSTNTVESAAMRCNHDRYRDAAALAVRMEETLQTQRPGADPESLTMNVMHDTVLLSTEIKAKSIKE